MIPQLESGVDTSGQLHHLKACETPPLQNHFQREMTASLNPYCRTPESTNFFLQCTNINFGEKLHGKEKDKEVTAQCMKFLTLRALLWLNVTSIELSTSMSRLHNEVESYITDTTTKLTYYGIPN